MTTVGFVVLDSRPEAVRTAADLLAHLDGIGVATRSLPAGSATQPPALGAAGGLDLIVSVGGDGTFLRAAYLARESGCPILGVKVGRLGFLTEATAEEAPALLEKAIAGSARIEERLAVQADPDGEVPFPPQWGLNEVMVEKRARHRLVRLAVRVGREYVTTFSADGVIVATPTGSTAYSFSARGPIVTPTVPCLVVTPIAAHMVFDRSFVLGADEQVTLEVIGDEPGLLSADGRESVELPVGARVRIRADDEPARFVRRDDAPGFLSLVREKFDLPGKPTLAPDVGGTR